MTSYKYVNSEKSYQQAVNIFVDKNKIKNIRSLNINSMLISFITTINSVKMLDNLINF